MYKVASDKAILILKCLSPTRIIINSPPFIDGSTFAAEFKKCGFNVLSFGKNPITLRDRELIKNLWNDKQKRSVIVEGYFTDIDTDIFTEPYSYVYLYPNIASEYSDLITKVLKSDEPIIESPTITEEIVKLRQLKPKKVADREIKKFIDERIKQNRENHKKYCELNNDRVFTVLV